MDSLRGTRRDRILQGLDVTDLRGAEIGPLSRPLIRKNESEVYYVDHCSAEDLKVKYASDPTINAEDVVHVDYVWSNEPAKDLLRDVCPLDYVVASHVIEHVPDLIGWLHEMHDTLREGGSLLLAVPDKRFTFDACRRISPMEEIRLAYGERRRRPGLRCIMDYFANIVRADVAALWNDYSRVEELPLFPESFLGAAATDYAAGRYVDVHCWVFTPWSFLKTLGRIVRETGLCFDLGGFQTTSSHNLEFFVRLVRAPRSTTDWEEEAARARAGAIWPENPGRAVQPALESVRAELAEAVRRAELAEARSAQLASRVVALESSTSWRITAPMRALAGVLRS